MRSGELRGLRYEDLDPQAGRVAIQRTRSATGPAKTARSVRLAALTHPTCEATAAWQAGATPESRAVLARLTQCVPLDPSTPLFPSLKRPGRPMEERELHTLWRRTVARARVRLRRPETLWHSGISSLLSRGAPLLAVAAQTGHSPRRHARLLRAVSGAAGAPARNPAATGGGQGLT
jgi:integrase